MFLDVLRRRNPGFLAVAAELHQAGPVPANTVVLDVDTIGANAAVIAAEAAPSLGLEAFAMTKQIGRHPAALRPLRAGGIDEVVAVDMPCAGAAHDGGLGIGHLGHLVQVTRHEAVAAAAAGAWSPASAVSVPVPLLWSWPTVRAGPSPGPRSDASSRSTRTGVTSHCVHGAISER